MTQMGQIYTDLIVFCKLESDFCEIEKSVVIRLFGVIRIPVLSLENKQKSQPACN